MIALYRKILTVTLSLYAIGTLTTMAGMEIFGWLSATLVLGGVLFLQSQLGLRKPLLSSIDWVLIGLCAIIVSSAFLAAPEGTDRVFVAGNGRFVFLFILLRLGLEVVSPEKSEKIFPWLVGIVAIVGAYAIFQNKTGIDLIRGHRNPIQQEVFGGVETFRARGMWDHPVRFGHSIALSLCFPIAFLISGYSLRARKSTVLTTLCIAAILLSGAGLFYSFTRGAWIGLAAGVLGMCVYISWKYAAKALGLGLVVVSLAVLASPELQGRFSSMLAPKTDGSSVARIGIWRANIEMFKDHPVLGVGYGVNEDLITEYFEKLGITQQDGGHAHNNFLQFLSGTGALGLATFLAFSILTLLFTHRFIQSAIARDDRFALAIGLAALGAQLVIHIGGLTECSFKSAQINHQFFLILALLLAMGRMQTSISATPARGLN